ncbi:MAG: glycosyltransferase [Kouleothrix sp.]|jgi:hypothetical protein|nr:glycosyltransferase [Kouleothrix sp.]
MLLPITLLCLLVAAIYAHDWLRELSAPLLAPNPAAPGHGPLISVLIPARDEAARIGRCLEGLAGQRYRSFEVIVVDDHSTDGTAGLACSYAGRLPALTVLPGAPLPEGWAGKCWACWQAAQLARGEWLLFLDADVLPRPELLAALVARATAGQRDLLTLMPLLLLGSPAERIVLPAFFALLYGLYPLQLVSDPRSPIAFANGPCLLIRRAAYAAVGGHQAVRASILEDTELGQRVKAAGYRLEAAGAPDLIAVRMYAGWASLAEGLTKNAVAGYRSGGTRSGLVGLRQALGAFTPWYLLGAGGLLLRAWPALPLGVVLLAHGAGLLLLALLCWGALTARRYRIGAWWGALYPLGTAIYFGLAAWGLLRLRSGRGVRWKGRVFRA